MTIKSELAQANAILDWLDGVMAGEVVDDFAMSFPIVRKVAEMKEHYEFLKTVTVTADEMAARMKAVVSK